MTGIAGANSVATLGRRYCTPDMTVGERVAHIGTTVTATGCHEWNGGRTDAGYGVLWVRKKHVYVHRFALENKLGRPIADGHFACHACDNPCCINPNHLFEGTVRDNNRDMEQKRRARGGRNGGGKPKFPAEAFVAVFTRNQDGLSVSAIHKMSPFSKSYVYGLLNGTSPVPAHAAALMDQLAIKYTKEAA